MSRSADRPETRLATRLSFLATGLSSACWAPLVPFAKANTGVDNAQLGLLILCLGIGAILAMPITGWFSSRFGSKSMILSGGVGMVLLLPALATVNNALSMGVALLGFGASLGTVDVATNVHAIEVERAAGKSLMSGFHAMFSLGGIIGAGGMTFLLWIGASPFTGALCGSALTMVALALAWPRLLETRAGEPTPFVAPHGVVLLIAGLATVTFVVEGAILDWSAVLIIGRKLVAPTQGGLGYMLFSIAMTIGRLTGDHIVSRAGNCRVLVSGGLMAVAGFILLLTASTMAMTGFLLIGLGASNIVPVLFSQAGHQTVMPTGLAVTAITTIAYVGGLAGPALVGFVSHATSLPAAFWLLAVLMALIPIFAQRATKGS